MASYRTLQFSIVVPTYLRTGQLSDLLFSLTRLKYRSTDFEVIVVDDGGYIPLEPIIFRFCDQLKLTLLRQEKNAGPAYARNKGAACAEGQFLAFIDDDCLVDPGWLQALSEGFTQSPHCICGGKTFNILDQNPYSTASQLLIDHLYEHFSPVDKFGGFFPTNNFAVPRKRFLEIDGFDPTLRFGEDREFCQRWTSRGYPFLSNPDAVVYHSHELNLMSFLRLHFLYGGGSFQFRRRCFDRNQSPGKLSPPSFYLRLIMSGITKEKSLRGLLFSLLLAASQMANTAGLMREAVKYTHEWVRRK